MISLNNGILEVKIDEFGAELKSLKFNETEYLWDGKSEIWKNSAPIMFPICGGLKENKYLLRGTEYNLSKHGFAKISMFEVESVNDTSAVFLLKSNDKTKESYPFDFEFRVIFTLEDRKLQVEYRVDNKTDKVMYFNVGSHEAYATPEGIEDYDIIFDTEETLSAHILYGNLLSKASFPMVKDSKTLPLYDKYFVYDAINFKDVKSDAATLRNRKNGRAIRIEFPDADYLVLWHKHGAGYICIEPWNGIPDVEESSFNIEEKEGIKTLESGGTYIFSHSMTVIE